MITLHPEIKEYWDKQNISLIFKEAGEYSVWVLSSGLYMGWHHNINDEDNAYWLSERFGTSSYKYKEFLKIIKLTTFL